jgi:hypothetical protein
VRHERDLQTLLDSVAEETDERKLRQLTAKLELALGRPLSTQVVDDPMVIRRQMVEYLRGEGTSPGNVQAMEQFFMGVVRRAAVKGLIPAPPEGPWTRSWQSVLDLSVEMPGTKAPLRSLAGWATARHLDPGNVSEEQLQSWAKETLTNEKVLPKLRDLLARWSLTLPNVALNSDGYLSKRLLSKAERGTVRDGPEDERTT